MQTDERWAAAGAAPTAGPVRCNAMPRLIRLGPTMAFYLRNRGFLNEIGFTPKRAALRAPAGAGRSSWPSTAVGETTSRNQPNCVIFGFTSVQLDGREMVRSPGYGNDELRVAVRQLPMTLAGEAALHRSSASGRADRRRLLEASSSDRREGGRCRGPPDKPRQPSIHARVEPRTRPI
jgi:hypothetical protein